MKRLLLPLLSVALLAGFRPAPPMITPPSSRIAGGPVFLTLLDRETGGLLPQYADDGKRWTPGERGHRYSVRLRNASPQRVLVVLSVDGINAVSGEQATPDQTGYVLNPWQTADISGWRKSQDEVAQFVFTSPGKSYAGRTGRPDNIGVIGIAVFREAGAVLTTPALKPVPGRRRLSTQEAGAQAEAMADSSARGSAAPAPAAPAAPVIEPALVSVGSTGVAAAVCHQMKPGRRFSSRCFLLPWRWPVCGRDGSVRQNQQRPAARARRLCTAARPTWWPPVAWALCRSKRRCV